MVGAGYVVHVVVCDVEDALLNLFQLGEIRNFQEFS